jgi:hypothetical protein
MGRMTLDWPVVAVLVVIFIVSSVARWRFFMARARRIKRPPPE